VRRFGFAGERSRAEDQIIDLMVGAEAIFLPGEDSESAHKLSLRAALLIAPAVQSSGSQWQERYIAMLMKRAYNARSRLAHGGVVDDVKMPDGTMVPLAAYVATVADYIRVALSQLIACVAVGGTCPLDDWDAFTYARFTAARATDTNSTA
jgi:hypothetical protein